MLDSVHIVNWKAYSDKTLYFSEGLNLFVGPNGSGKTTILDAISLALTGSISSADFKHLVRDPRSESAITVRLRVSNSTVSVVRSFSRERISGGQLSMDGSSPRALSWEALNRQLADELKVDPVFFSRIIYMSEGEVFEYAKNPPAEAIDNAVQGAFGIEKLRLLSEELEGIERYFDKSSQSFRTDLAKMPTLGSVPTLDVGTLRRAVQQHQDELTKAQQGLADLRKGCETKRTRFADVRRINNEVSPFLKEVGTLGLQLPQVEALSRQIDDLLSQVHQKTDELDRNFQSLSLEKGELQSREKYLMGILDLLVSVSEEASQGGIPCPVCQRPIDKTLSIQLLGDTKTALESVRTSLKTTDERVDTTRVQLQRFRAASQRVSYLSSQIAVLTVPMESDGLRIHLNTFNEYVGLQEKQLVELEQQLLVQEKSVNTLAGNLENEKLAIARLEGSAAAGDVQTTVRGRLIESYRGLILSSVVHRALQKSIVNLRDIGLKPFYEALAQLWRKCRPEHEGEITFDADGKLMVRFGSTQIGFSQLSGGEKTVLLVLARVLMCSMFSDVDFMMIDEPLEHLDSRNRRSVLNFLVAATRGRLIKQAVVTTFEESLVRKYLDRDIANVVYLPRP
jgi:DNA repair exonuclease SbcCD ATPase subunit